MKQKTLKLCHLDCDCWHVIETVLHAAHRTRFVSQCENKNTPLFYTSQESTYLTCLDRYWLRSL